MRGAVLYSKERGSMREETEKEFYEWQMAKAREAKAREAKATTFPIMFSILFIRWEKREGNFSTLNLREPDSAIGLWLEAVVVWTRITRMTEESLETFSFLIHCIILIWFTFSRGLWVKQGGSQTQLLCDYELQKQLIPKNKRGKCVPHTQLDEKERRRK